MTPGLNGPSNPQPSDRAELAPPVFRLTAGELDGGFQELRVEGELDLSVAEHLRERIAATDGHPVLVDLGECTFIDSTGIAVVLLARRDGKRIAMHSPSERVRRVLAVTGLTGDGVVFDGRDEAMSELAARAAED